MQALNRLIIIIPRYLLWVLCLTIAIDGFAQAPNISYPSTFTYNANTPITPIVPSNSGGAVPANRYGEVVTFAGSTSGYVDGVGTAAKFNWPVRLARASNGDLYVTDIYDDVIRKIKPDGTVTTFVTNNLTMEGIAIDNQDNIYVTLQSGVTINKINPNGTFTPLAGSGLGYVNGVGTAAKFNRPKSIVADAMGNIYVADTDNHLIRKITPNGTVSTVAGTTQGDVNGTTATAKIYQPSDVAIDAVGNLYVADYGNNKIKKITPGGVVSTLAGVSPGGTAKNGPAALAIFLGPSALALDAIGNVYVTDMNNSQIRKIGTDGMVTTVAGTTSPGAIDGIGTDARFGQPNDLVYDPSGFLYVSEAAYKIRKVSITGYAIDKPLPVGLTFDATTGIISGTPTGTSPATTYTITAYNTSGSSSSTINIAVLAAAPIIVAPPVISYQTPQTYTVNTTIPTLTPTNAGGAVPATKYGEVTTFAGSSIGFTNGTGIAAKFSSPARLTRAANGDIYVADRDNNAIRKITPGGVVTTFASGSFSQPNGITINNNTGDVYVADAATNSIKKITPQGVVSVFAGGSQGATDGLGTAARFFYPYSVIADAVGNLYVADTRNSLIRKITTNGTVTTFAGSVQGYADGIGTAARFDNANNISIAASGDIYVTDVGNYRVRKITQVGVVTTVGGISQSGNINGNVTLASFNTPAGVTTDDINNIYVADIYNNQIRKISPSGTVTTIAGSLTSGTTDDIGTAAKFNRPNDVQYDPSGFLYVTDYGNSRIRKLIVTGYTIDKPLPAGLVFDQTTGKITGTPTVTSPAQDYTITAYNTGGSSSATVNIAVSAALPVVIAPPNISYQTPQSYLINKAIAELAPANTGGAVPTTIYGLVSTVASSFNTPTSLALDGAGNIFVADWGSNTIKRINPNGSVITYAGSGIAGSTDGQGTAASFTMSDGLIMDAAGNLYVTDDGTDIVRKITPQGLVSTFARGFSTPRGMDIDALGNIFVADQASNTIKKITPAGIVSTYAGNGSAGFSNSSVATSATFNFPTSVCFDPEGNLYVADGSNNAIRKITPAGVVTTFATGLNFPRELRMDASGYLYVANQNSNNIKKISPAGVVTTLAGSGQASAADGNSNIAGFNSPIGLILDGLGNLFLADALNNRVRKVVLTGYTIDKPLPSGLVFDQTTGKITGIPTVQSPAQNYTVTAFNAGGSSTTTVNIAVTTLPQAVITFPAISASTADANNNITPNATSTNTQTPITYASDNTSVAVITNGLIHIVGPGTVNIIASQAGNAGFVAATPVSRSLRIYKTPLLTFPTIAVKPICTTDFGANVVSDVTTLPIVYVSSNTAVATISAQGLIHIVGPGTTSITASQAGDNILYLDAQPVSQILTVSALPIMPSVIIAASANNIYAGVNVTFTAISTNAGMVSIYQWKVNGDNVGANNATYNSNAFKNGDIVTCTITSSIACTVPVTSAAVIVNILPAPSITISNTFTPNGDGINDIWNIPELVNYPNCIMSIYSRYGKLVYQSKGYSTPWNGLANNEQLPLATYYYVLTLGTGIPNGKLSGAITIIR